MSSLCFAVTGSLANGRGGDAPKRVVSINLCTDQLAMLLASEKQLLSVSHIARDPLISAMSEQAMQYDVNYGRAEEVYLLAPDLVLASEYSDPATLNMIERLGIRVARFEPASSFDDVRARIHEMGAVLGREEAAYELRQQFDARRARFDNVPERPTALLYSANGYTSGSVSLASEILDLAGFENMAPSLGYPNGGVVPLEILALHAPDALVEPQRYKGGSRAEEILEHPVVDALRRNAQGGQLMDGDWVCATPFLLDAADELRQIRRAMIHQVP